VSFTMSAWYLIALIPLGIITYFAMLIVVTLYLSRTITAEEIEEAKREDASLQRSRAAHTEDIPEEMTKAGFTDRVEIEETSETIGTYQGVELYEWVKLKAGNEPAEKFDYFGPAQIINGVQIMPEIPGKWFANIEGVLYVKELPQPVL
jgi:hypothetical protein